MPLYAGDKLGPYEILAPIGKGGMGDVYRARDPRLNRNVAIKFSAAEFSERFDREAKSIAALNHPNICQVYDVGPNYLVMEFIEGTPLQGPLQLDEALSRAIQIADALSAAHAKGITHRDLKPANILVTAHGIKLLDFGLALFRRGCNVSEPATEATASVSMTQAGTILGTAAYMSPEQAEGKPVDACSDIFSFGSVLYEMLSGRRAFTGDSAIGVMAAILREEPEPLQVPPALQSILVRCLRKSPADRFQSIVHVKQALLALTSGVGAPAGRAQSIAVLPFTNMSADKENEYFSDGLAEEILNLLAKVPGLKVIARTSSFAFRGKEQDITKIAEALRVQHILEGSVRRSGNRIRVTVQLIHADDGAHVWSERYDRDMTDVFVIQDEIGQAISEALKLRLAPRTKTVNIEAYQNYLKGQYHFLRFTPESMGKAKQFFGQALAIDPDYASAYSGLAVYYYTLATFGITQASEVAPLVKSSAEKALAIDPADSEAHSVLASIAAMFDYDWKVAEQHFRKAMAAEPVPPMVRFRYAFYRLHTLRRLSDAMEQIRLGLDTDPLSMILHYSMVVSMQHARQYREAVEYARRAMEIDASYFLKWYAMGLAQLGAGFTLEAITSLQRVVELAPWWHMGVWSLAAAYWRSGDGEHSQEWARKVAGSHGHTFGASRYYAITGEVDAMFEALDGAYRQRNVFLLALRHELFFDPYRADPRFQALLRRMDIE
jgi:eukaryotic-like serine/threonine-protein kinase